jgi:hypothetical protein
MLSMAVRATRFYTGAARRGLVELFVGVGGVVRWLCEDIQEPKPLRSEERLGGGGIEGASPRTCLLSDDGHEHGLRGR